MKQTQGRDVLITNIRLRRLTVVFFLGVTNSFHWHPARSAAE